MLKTCKTSDQLNKNWLLPLQIVWPSRTNPLLPDTTGQLPIYSGASPPASLLAMLVSHTNKPIPNKSWHSNYSQWLYHYIVSFLTFVTRSLIWNLKRLGCWRATHTLCVHYRAERHWRSWLDPTPREHQTHGGRDMGGCQGSGQNYGRGGLRNYYCNLNLVVLIIKPTSLMWHGPSPVL